MTRQPEASSTSSPSRPVPTATIDSPSISTSASNASVAVTTRPPRMSRVIGRSVPTAYGTRLGLPATARRRPVRAPRTGATRWADDRRLHARAARAGDEPPAGDLHPGAGHRRRARHQPRPHHLVRVQGPRDLPRVSRRDPRLDVPVPYARLRGPARPRVVLSRPRRGRLPRRRTRRGPGGRLLRGLDHRGPGGPVQGPTRNAPLVSPR